MLGETQTVFRIEEKTRLSSFFQRAMYLSMLLVNPAFCDVWRDQLLIYKDFCNLLIKSIFLLGYKTFDKVATTEH